VLQKKGRGHLIHVSDFINEENGRLIVRDSQGNITQDARKIIYPGSNGDAWWDNNQLLVQVKEAIRIFETAHPDCVSLFVFDQSSAHASLPPDALRAFDMNKSDGGKQRKQRDTVVPNSNPVAELRGKFQKMTLEDGTPKGLQHVLEERGFNVKNLRAKCSPVCPWDNTDCCMARLLSKQEDFAQQRSMLEILIKDAGHECIFLPKFHCELNPIEMASLSVLNESMSSVADPFSVLGLVQVQIPRSSQENICRSKASRHRETQCLSSRSLTAVHQSLMEIHECIPPRAHRKSCYLGCEKAEAAP
jgi:hypothetical protein